ncbi:MAG: hypothetical protein ACOC1X_04200 [Promethearchaeota archaeon]
MSTKDNNEQNKPDKGKMYMLISLLDLFPLELLINDLKKAIVNYESNNSSENLEKIKHEIAIIGMKLEIDSKGVEKIRKDLEKFEQSKSIMDRLDGKLS